MKSIIPLCRAKCIGSNNYISGYYVYKPLMDKHFIVREEFVPYSHNTVIEETEIRPDTVEMPVCSDSNASVSDVFDLLQLHRHVFCTGTQNKQLMFFKRRLFADLRNNPKLMYWAGMFTGAILLAAAIALICLLI